MGNSQRNLAYLVLGVILISSFAVMHSVSSQESAIVDEMAHIPAGYSYVKYFDYRLNPEHPPLVKMLAGLPLVFLDLKFPTDQPYWQSEVNGQWASGDQFVYGGDNDADTVIQWARLGPMLLTLLLVFFIYWWGKELIGRWWALLPAFLFAFSPTVLAHGHFVTTDVGASLGVFISIYYFIKARMNPSTKNLAIAGVAFGIAQLLKFSAVIIVLYLIILTAVFLFADIYRKWHEPGGKTKRVRLEFLKHLKNLVIIFVVSILVVYPLYSLATVNYPPEKQKSDTEFILSSFAKGKTPEGEICNPKRCLADLDIWMADKPILRPYGQYMLGVLMVLQRAAGGNTYYYLGEVRNESALFYFPVTYLMKESLPVLILVFGALVFSLWRLLKSGKKNLSRLVDYLQTHPAEFSMLLFVVLYVLYSMLSNLNIGVRHLLPTLPLVYILTASGLRAWLKSNHFKTQIKLGLIGIALIWFTADVASTYPYYLSYFNQGLGTQNGWKYVTDSNYDWGQDMKKLQTFVEQNNVDKIAIDYFGSSKAPGYYLNGKAENWSSNKGDPRDIGIHWLAVSINTLQGAKAELAPGQNRNAEGEYQWLQNYQEPYAKAGTSIFIYKLD